MELKRIDCKLTVCKVTEVSSISLESDFYFIGKTDEEVSLVCKTEDTPIIRWNEMMDGEVFAFKEFLIFH